MTTKTEYIGDGVYALLDNDGGMWLHANDHLNPTDKIYLEPKVFVSLYKFYKHQMEVINVSKKNKR